MANQHKHPLRGVRGVDDQLWSDLDTTAKTLGTDRSRLTRQLWEWMVGRPGSVLPERPASSKEASGA